MTPIKDGRDWSLLAARGRWQHVRLISINLPCAPRARLLSMSDLTDDKLALAHLIHDLGWERGEIFQSILRLSAAVAAIVLLVAILGS